MFNLALAIDNWVHRRSYEGTEHGTKIARLETEWETFKVNQSKVANRLQDMIGPVDLRVKANELQLARVEEHLKFIDRNDTPRPKDRR